MKSTTLPWCIRIALALVAQVSAATVTVEDVNGSNFLSPLQDQVVNVTGIVTAKRFDWDSRKQQAVPQGIFIASEQWTVNVSHGLYVYSGALASNASISKGNRITISGKVSAYRGRNTDLFLTELKDPKVLDIMPGDKLAEPLVIGQDTNNPPTEQFTSLDGGEVFATPNNQSQLSKQNPALEPEKYGIDFWQSLGGQRVTIRQPAAVTKAALTNASDPKTAQVWVTGTWLTTSKNSRGGLTLSVHDANPEAILIGGPLDGSGNDPNFKVGDSFADITGILTYQSGHYIVLPDAPVRLLSSTTPVLPPPSSFASDGVCSGLTFGDYNIENFWAGNALQAEKAAGHIVTYMKTPDLMFLQEVQDNNGEGKEGVVNADETLALLVDKIQSISNITYAFTYISPENNADGGAPNANIRVAYLYRPDVLRLRNNATQGGALDANEVLAGPGGPTLKFNPGRIDPRNASWLQSRKPLAAHWETLDGQANFFTVNVHFGSKGGGSSSLQGDVRPPINNPVEKRNSQAEITASFIASILAQDPDAAIIFAGDCNEFAGVKPMVTFESISHMVHMDEAAGIQSLDRYTYVFDSSMQQLDHMYLSPAVANRTVLGEHIHVNTWVSALEQTSDHDPTVAKLNVCRNQFRNPVLARVQAVLAGGFVIPESTVL